MRTQSWLCLGVVLGLVVTGFSQQERKHPLPIVGVPDHASGIYRVGEKIGWTFSLRPGSEISGPCTYSVRAFNKTELAHGTMDPAHAPARIEFTPTQPEMVYVDLSVPGAPNQAFGAAVSPEKLKPVAERPRDFDAFWKGKLAGLRKVPENAVLTPGDGGRKDVSYWTIKMDHVNGTHVYGQMAMPAKPGKYPAILQLQWASPPYRLWPDWITGRAAQGFLVLNIEPHDVLPTEPQSYYNSLPTEIKNYHMIHQDDKDKNYFVEMYLRGVRAIDYLSHNPNWDGKTLIVMGTSMGGQQSLCVAGLCPNVTHVIVNEPSGCDLNAGLHDHQPGYPNFDLSNPKAAETARYVDAVNFAPKIKARALVAMGFVDTIAPPTGIWTAFDQIRSPKEAAPMFDSPHNNTATPQEQLPYTSRAEAWLAALAKGERP